MIKQLNFNDRDIIEKIVENTPNAIRIKALFKAYGMGLNFMSFYADETGDIVIALQDNTATLYLKDKSKKDEAVHFLKLIANSVLAEDKLFIDGYIEEIGNSYVCNKISPIKLDEISNEIQDGYNVLHKIFKDSINSTTYQRWYTDMSHRVRHDMSKIYTYKGLCSATAYCNVEGQLLLAQVGTLSGARGQGLASKLIHHTANDQQPIEQIVLLSQDNISDKFYENIGFEFLSNWYYYVKN